MNEELDYYTIDTINQRLDELADRIFSSVDSIEGVIGGIFSDHGIKFPGGLVEEEDSIYKLEGEDNLFLYVIIDREIVGYSVFAQIMEEQDIVDVQNEMEEPQYSTTSDFLRRVRRSADD